MTDTALLETTCLHTSPGLHSLPGWLSGGLEEVSCNVSPVGYPHSLLLCGLSSCMSHRYGGNCRSSAPCSRRRRSVPASLGGQSSLWVPPVEMDLAVLMADHDWVRGGGGGGGGVVGLESQHCALGGVVIWLVTEPTALARA